MYVADMSVDQARDWLAERKATLSKCSTSAQREQVLWDIEDLKAHIKRIA
jgi:hypothetical protein